jgi:glutamate racemase
MTSPIGVFDSGIGGLSVLKALQSAMPGADFLYVADSAHAPYGERSDAFVAARALRIGAWLASQGASALVVACNTATAAAIADMRMAHVALPVIGIEPAVKPAAALSATGCIGVMATRGTLASDKFARLLAAQPAGVRFFLQACDGLADAIERSALSADPAPVSALCTRYIGALGAAAGFGSGSGQIDTLVLGCTHYPLVQAQLQALVGAEVRIVSNGDAVAQQTLRRLAQPPVPGGARAASLRLLCTSEPQRLQAAALAWLGSMSKAELLPFL